MEIEQSINLHLNVIFCDYILACKIIHLLTQINRIRVDIATVMHRNYRLCTVYKRNNQIDTRLECRIILTQTFYNSRFTLWNNHHSHLNENDGQNNEGRHRIIDSHTLIYLCYQLFIISTLLLQ